MAGALAQPWCRIRLFSKDAAMSGKTILLTGFEPYGGGTLNPSTELVNNFDGRSMGDYLVVGRTLPVSQRDLASRIVRLMDEWDPKAVVSLGLWPGEPVLRLERVAVNVADFEIPDNDGVLLRDAPLSASAATAHLTTLPLRTIEDALIDAGIPARISSTAGTFLCNATMFGFLDLIAARGRSTLAGFVHVPYLPQQVAAHLDRLRRTHDIELHQRADLASMELSTMLRAVEIVVQTIIATAPRS
jgi:pyroglutamyl-peptidase